MKGRAKSWRDVFERLDRWRNLPKYQLERRADIFFSLYLIEIMQAVIGKRNQRFLNLMIPEFPLLKQGGPKSKSGKKRHLSNNVDYLMFSKPLGKNREPRKIWLAELKTDLESIKAQQIEYLHNAVERGFSECIRGLLEIARRTKSRQKYYHLLHTLITTGIVNVASDYQSSITRNPARSASIETDSSYDELVDRIILAPEWSKAEAEIVFITPNEVEIQSKKRGVAIHNITFSQITNFLMKQKGELPRVFAKSLNRWAEHKAGFDVSKLD